MRVFPVAFLCAVMALPLRAQPVPELALTPEQLAPLPQHRVVLPHGYPPVPQVMEGPLLWDVLVASGVVDPASHDEAVRQWLHVRGADGHAAVLALGEISPDFEGKEVILAVRADGVPLDRPWLAIPGERRPGRSAEDVVAIGVERMVEPDR